MSGRYKAYGEYKESGVEWVGSMPSHWTIEPLFSNCDAPIEKNSDGREKNVLSLSYGNIIPRDVDDNFGLLPESFNTYQLVYPQNIILRLTDLQNDKRSLRVGFSKQQGIITSAYLKLVFTKKMSSPFMYRLLHSYDTTKVFYGMGGGLRQSMKFEDFRRLPLLIPSFAEQTQIAAFLDHETAKIDTLIGKQQQLIELLKEKRQAVISHAVTKGLDPDVPMKDSGVDWLGSIPRNWGCVSISRMFTRIKRTGHIDRELLSVYRDYGVIPKSSRDDNNNKPSEDLSPYQLVEINNLVVNKMKAWQGSIAISGCEGIVSPAYFVYSPKIIFNDLALPKYIHYLLRNSIYITQYLSRSKGIRVNQWDLDPDEFKSIDVLLPTKEEQTQIAAFLDHETAKIDKLIDLQLQQIELLKERRTALISAAVTGKIDVRDWQVPVTQTESDEVMA
ncbi:restriction endonuclease subunit S [Rahnella victoriana]|nr:restriction endonuclease subunit S [Rahnella victoriana]